MYTLAGYFGLFVQVLHHVEEALSLSQLAVSLQLTSIAPGSDSDSSYEKCAATSPNITNYTLRSTNITYDLKDRTVPYNTTLMNMTAIVKTNRNMSTTSNALSLKNKGINTTASLLNVKSTNSGDGSDTSVRSDYVSFSGDESSGNSGSSSTAAAIATALKNKPDK